MLNRREVISAIGASLLLNAGLVTAFVKALPAEEAKHQQVGKLVYHNYGYDNPKTGVCCYAYDTVGFSVHFKSGIKRYWYARTVFGDENIDELITRAKSGHGLNSYLNYLRKWERPQ